MIRMNNVKTFSLLMALFFLVACGSTSSDEQQLKEQQLADYQKQLTELQEKIFQLEEELNIHETTAATLVRVEKVAPQRFVHEIEVTGDVEAEEDVNVSPETSGNIIAVNVAEGAYVKKGDVLGQLNTEAIERSIEDLKVQLELARTVFERQQKLWDMNIGSEIEFLQAKSNHESMERKLEGLYAQLDMAIIKSPINGVVDRIYQKRGAIAGPQLPFAKVVNIDRVRIYADVSERFLNAVDAGDHVKIEFPAIAREVEATIYRKSNVINPDNRTFRLRVNLNNHDGQIKPNLISVLHIFDFENDAAVVVPSLVVKNDVKGNYVYIATQNEEQWNAEKRYVDIGHTNNNSTMLTSGLTEGEHLITEGYDQVTDGALVAIR